jgi:adenosylcobinamide-phosphate synthase
MPWLNALPAWLILALLALIASRLISLPAARAPFKVIALLLRRLASRVHPDASRSHFQQQLSGSLALMLMLAVPLAITYGVYLISELPLVLDALLLYFCLGSRQTMQQAATVATSLSRQQLSLAKDQAKPLLLRQRDNLSAMGLSKACIESVLQQQAAAQVAVLLWFVIGGGLLVLAFTLLQTAAQQWNSKLPHYRYFGRTTSIIYHIAVAPGLLMSALLIAIQTGVIKAWRVYRAAENRYFSWPCRLLLATGASALQIKLGGPAYYGGIKIQRDNIGHYHDPVATDIQRTLLLINAQQTALIVLCSSVLALYVANILLLS